MNAPNPRRVMPGDTLYSHEYGLHATACGSPDGPFQRLKERWWPRWLRRAWPVRYLWFHWLGDPEAFPSGE